MFSAYPRPIILAHRGASAYAPENTLPAFELAIEHGADGIELDAKLSADGEVVVIHDEGVERTTDGQGRVSSLTLQQLQALDAGVTHSTEFHGLRIPTLLEVFEALGKRAIINIELTNYSTPYDPLVEKVCSLIKKHAIQDQILFSSFLARNLTKAARLLPDVPRGLLALPGWMGIWPRSFGFMFGDFQALHTHISDVDPQQVQRVHRIKRNIHVWTVNAIDDLQRLKEWEVDGIFTDDPRTAVATLRRPV